MKILWFPIGDINTASTRIMCYLPSAWLNKNGIQSDVFSGIEDAKEYDILIFQKVYDNSFQDLAKEMKSLGKKIIYIIDDLYEEGFPMAKMADIVVCGSDYIKEWIRPFTKAELHVMDDAYETPKDLCKKSYDPKDRLKVTWFGTLLHFPQAEEMRPIIEQLGFKYETITAHAQATKRWSLDTIWDDLLNTDVIIIPFLGELPPYELAKGNNRLTQSMVLGLPVVTSPIPAYLPIIKQGKNGFICYNNTKEDFVNYLTLLKDHTLRSKIGARARLDVIEEYSIDSIGKRWLKILNNVKHIPTKKSKGSVLLYYPEVSYIKTPGLHRAPYSTLSIAQPLIDEGYEVDLFDARVDDVRLLNNYLSKKPIFIGVSSLIGQQLRDAGNFARYIKSLNLPTPIVWGGWAASLIPEDLIKESFVDIVAKGQFEHRINNLIEDIQSGEKSCPGALWKAADGNLTDTGAPSLPDKLSKAPVELLDLDKYGPYWGFLTSLGCYMRCKFCSGASIWNRKYRCKDIDDVIQELIYVIKTKKHVIHLNLDDDEFFWNKKRVIEFCEKWINTKLNRFPISTLVHVRAALTYPNDLYHLMHRAGIREVLIGAESGSQTILDRLDKRQTKDHVLQFVEKITQFGMIPDLSTMTGFPDSDEIGDFKETILMLQEAYRINPHMKFKLFWVRPYPGAGLFEDFKAQGYRMPQTFKEWTEYTLRYTPSWVSRELSDMVNFFLAKYLPEHGWVFTWDNFINEFWRCRELDQIPIQRGM